MAKKIAKTSTSIDLEAKKVLATYKDMKQYCKVFVTSEIVEKMAKLICDKANLRDTIRLSQLHDLVWYDTQRIRKIV